MNRRAYLAACGAMLLSGCLDVFVSNDTPQSGDVVCADGIPAGSSNGPADGLWSAEFHDMQNTSQTIAPGPSGCVETRWMRSPNAETGLTAGPLVTDGSVYLPNQRINETWFNVVDARTGEEQWQYGDTDYEQLLPDETPTLVEDKLYLVDHDNIARVDLPTQSTDWFRDFTKDPGPNPGIGVPRVKNGTIYVGVDTGIETGVETGIVLALDAETGAREWVHDIEGLPADTTIEGDSESHAEARRQGKPSGAVAVTDERVYVPSWDLSLHALNAETGEREWQFSPGNDNMDRLQAPTVVDGNVYLQNVRAILYVLDAETGELRWTYDEYGDASDGISPIVDDDSVYIIAGTSTENLRLVALERDGGSVRWEHPVGPPFQDPVADANSVYIDQGRNLKAIEKETGDHKWTLKTDRALAAPASVADEAIFIADQSHFYGIW